MLQRIFPEVELGRFVCSRVTICNHYHRRKIRLRINEADRTREGHEIVVNGMARNTLLTRSIDGGEDEIVHVFALPSIKHGGSFDELLDPTCDLLASP